MTGSSRHDYRDDAWRKRADNYLDWIDEKEQVRVARRQEKHERTRERIYACVICRPAYLALCDRLTAADLRTATARAPKGLSTYLLTVARQWRATPETFRDARPFALCELDWLRKKRGEQPIWSAWNVPPYRTLLTLVPPDYRDDPSSWQRLVDADIVANSDIQTAWEYHPWNPYADRVARAAEARIERAERAEIIAEHKELGLPPPKFPPRVRRTVSISPVIGEDAFGAFEEIRQHFGIDSYAHVIEALAFGWISHPPVTAPANRRRPKVWYYPELRGAPTVSRSY